MANQKKFPNRFEVLSQNQFPVQFLIKWLGFSLFFHLLAGVFSLGFYDMDEHFQILEFMNYRLGRSGADRLAWEYAAQIRPWLQPFLYEGIARIASLLGLTSPFQWALWIRLFSTLLGWGSLVALSLCCFRWFKGFKGGERKWAELSVKLLCLFWCLPYQHARTSSENLSGTLLVFAIAFYVLAERKRFLLLIGFLLGLSFDVRFQMGIAAAAFFLWMWIVDRQSFRNLLMAIAGCLAAVALGLTLDAWGYQRWTLTPWNYLYQNLVLGVAAHFGTTPFWHYLNLVTEALPPFGALILIGVLSAWIFYPTHLLSVITGVFFLAHSLLSHKEQRFLYPMLSLVPILLVLGLKGWTEFLRKSLSAHRLQEKVLPLRRILLRPAQVLLYGLLLYDLGALFIGSVKPSTNHPKFYEAVYDRGSQIPELYYTGMNPYELGNVEVHFYRRPELKLRHIPTLNELEGLLKTKASKDHAESSQPLWFFFDQDSIPDSLGYLKDRCQLAYSVFPRWMNTLSFLPGPARFACRWSLFQCE